jgi:predicted metal-dependent hydrolase
MKLINEFNIKIIRTSRRKTVSLQIINGIVKVTAPKYLSDKQIYSVISSKAKWIRKNLAVEQLGPPFTPKKFINNELFSFLGASYPLEITDNKFQGTTLLERSFLVNTKLNGKEVHVLLKEWFRKQALSILTDRTNIQADRLGLFPKKISIRDYKSRWGSCNGRGEITYNWKIIMAPLSIVDYVIVHELCHLTHHNHSKDYWNSVGISLPSYKTDQNWLKANGKLLDW